MGFEVHFRTHTCGELNTSNIGQQVTLAGWVNRRRDHGGLIFLDIRDRYGITQVICDPERSPEAHRVASELRSEYVVQVAGTVVPRLPGTENPNLATGAIEVAASHIELLNPSRTTPFPISDTISVDESLRLTSVLQHQCHSPWGRPADHPASVALSGPAEPSPFGE